MPNPKKKTPADIGSLARAYTVQSIRILGGYLNAQEGVDDEIRLRAIGMLLDRGWGKPAQPVTGKDGEEPIEVIVRTIIEGKKS